MLTEKMIRAARLEPALYEEVEADVTATNQALQVVVIASLAGGIGGGLNSLFAGGGLGGLVVGLVVGMVFALVGWFIFSYLTYWIGTTFFEGKATYGELLRCIGFADSPGVLSVLSFIPVLGGLVTLAAAVWVLIATIIAVRQALDFTPGKAIATAIIGWIVMLVILALAGLVVGGLALALGV